MAPPRFPRLALSAETAAALDRRLLCGRRAEDLLLVPATAQLQLATATADEVAALSTASELAQAKVPLVTDGLPTIIRATAWIGHEGRNRNGLRFLREELPAAAAKIAEPNFLVMDFNHSAVQAQAPHPKAIGLWYRGAYAFDPKARAGDGAWGILLQGMAWAWAFPDYANELLAEQTRHGAIRFSMACLPESEELVREADGSSSMIAHNPVFFTLSALNVPPADPDALGLAVEGDTSEGVEERHAEQLLGTPVLAAAHAHSNPQEDIRMPANDPMTLEVAVNKVAELSAELTTAQARVAELEEACRLLADSQTKISDGRSIDQFVADYAALETTMAELTASREAVTTELASAQATLAERTARLEELEAAEAVRQAEAVEAARVALVAARVASLPEAYREAHAKHAPEVRERIEAKWAAMSEEEFDVYKTHELQVAAMVAPGTPTPGANRPGMFLRRSQEEGNLPMGAGGESNSTKARIRALLKKS
jgi:hypothetical protein